MDILYILDTHTFGYNYVHIHTQHTHMHTHIHTHPHIQTEHIYTYTTHTHAHIYTHNTHKQYIRTHTYTRILLIMQYKIGKEPKKNQSENKPDAKRQPENMAKKVNRILSMDYLTVPSDGSRESSSGAYSSISRSS